MCSMALRVTANAKSNQVVRHIAAELAPPFHMMDLQVLHGTAVLTPPSVSFENVSSKDCIFFGIQLKSFAPRARRRRIR
jgi:hypothetical protein